MKKLLLLTAICLTVSACEGFHTKQPIDDNYYKKTQSVEWPDQNKAASSTTVSSAKKTTVTYAKTAQEQHAKMAVPDAPELKFECIRSGSYFKCSYGLDVCGTGCKADGSECNHGYCLQSDCDNVMGQKWELVKERDRYACKHPDYPITCTRDYGKVQCRDQGQTCGWDCNANGTLCKGGANNCWDAYRK